MGVGMTQEMHKKALQDQLRRDGGKLPEVPDGPRLDYFSALELAQAIEHEVHRIGDAPLRKIRLDMDAENALKLASYLRRAVVAGV